MNLWSKHNSQFLVLIGFISLLIFLSMPATAADKIHNQGRYGGKYNVPLSGEPESLDPAFITAIYAVTVLEGKTKTVTGLEILNRYKLKITLDQPFAPFLSILAMAIDTQTIVKNITKRGSIFAG